MPYTGTFRQFIAVDSRAQVPTTELRDVWTTGTLWYVDYNNGADSGNSGLTSDSALKTIATALTLCQANAHDVLLLMPGHAETLESAGGLSISTAGVTIMGLGNGTNAATFTLATDNAAGLNITGANVTIKNVRFVVAKDGLTNVIDVVADHVTIESCEFIADSSYQPVTFIDLSAAGSDDCKIWYCEFWSESAGATGAIKITGTCNNANIYRNKIVGDWSSAGIYSAAIFTQASIWCNEVHNANTGEHAIEFTDACTGSLGFNVLYSDAVATSLDPGSMFCFGNLYVSAIDTGAVEVPITGTGEDFIGADNNNNNAATTNVVANADGSLLERVEFLQAELAAHLAAGSGTALASNKSLCNCLGTDGTTVTDVAVSVLGAIGANNNNNAFDSSTVVANADGSLHERTEFVQVELAAHLAKGSGTEMGTNMSVCDCLGTDGATVTDSATSVLGAIGANNANNAFDSSTVAANEDGSVHERLEQIQEAVNKGSGTALGANQSIVDYLLPKAATGEADIDISEADYTGYINLLLIEPAASAPLCDLKVTFDLDKATTGFATIHAAETLQFAVARKVDGTNWRIDNQSPTTAIAGNAADGMSVTLDVGMVDPTADVRIVVKVSAEVGDVEFPYVAHYRGPTATFTPVAAA